MKKIDYIVRFWSVMLLLMAPVIFVTGCGSGNRSGEQIPDTINVATLYGPASFFFYRDTNMGFDYDLMEEIAKEHSRVVNWVIVNSIEDAVDMVAAGDVMLIAAPVPTDGKYDAPLKFCGPETYTEQVLVQPPGDTVVVDVNQLEGRTIYVEKDSKGARELEKLNKELGGSIRIRQVDADSLATEDLLASVARGDIPLAVVDRQTARLNKSYFPELNITLALSSPETSRWAVSADMEWFGKTIDKWTDNVQPRDSETELLTKYFDSMKNFPVEGASWDRQLNNGYASPYDDLFRQHAAGSTWDWRMLAAQAYQESRFDSTATSWAGAKGLMQIMPKTAKDFGLKKTDMTNTSKSIETAVKILDKYDSMLEPMVTDPLERQKFVLAAYNAGPGHVFDAIRLAEKYGYDPQVWDNNVEKAMLMKMKRKYYRDKVVKFGYSRGRETVDYVRRIYQYYDEVKEKIPHDMA